MRRLQISQPCGCYESWEERLVSLLGVRYTCPEHRERVTWSQMQDPKSWGSADPYREVGMDHPELIP